MKIALNNSKVRKIRALNREKLQIKVEKSMVGEISSFSEALELDGSFNGNITLEDGRDLILNSNFKLDENNYLMLNPERINVIFVRLTENIKLKVLEGNININIHEMGQGRIEIETIGNMYLKTNETIHKVTTLGGDITLIGDVIEMDLDKGRNIKVEFINQKEIPKLIGVNRETFREISGSVLVMEKIVECVDIDDKVKMNILYDLNVEGTEEEVIISKKYIDRNRIEIYLFYGEKKYKLREKV